MNQPYSFWADWLSKFYTWPELIQALWITVVPLMVLGTIPVTLLGAIWLITRGPRDARDLPRPRTEHGCLSYSMSQDAESRWTILRHGAPPDSTGGGQMIRGVFPRSEE